MEDEAYENIDEEVVSMKATDSARERQSFRRLLLLMLAVSVSSALFGVLEFELELFLSPFLSLLEEGDGLEREDWNSSCNLFMMVCIISLMLTIFFGEFSSSWDLGSIFFGMIAVTLVFSFLRSES